MKVSVIGTGYVGLVSGVCLADNGCDVVCVDSNPSIVETLNAAKATIFEKGLDELLAATVGRSLRCTTNLRQAVLSTDLSLIAVGTPFRDGKIDLSFIRTVAEQIGSALKEKESYHVVVVKSTVVPGTTEEVVLPLLEQYSGKKAGRDLGVGMNPEFLREGEAVGDFLNPDRIVLGGIDERTIRSMDAAYEKFDTLKIRTTPRTAEMIKYTANSLLATAISFSNEIANLCSNVGVDAVDVMNGVCSDKRLSPILADGKRIRPSFIDYLAGGCGFGGSCFPKDVAALVAFAEEHGNSLSILESVLEINRRQPSKMLELLQSKIPSLHDKKIFVLGVAFKPGTDDVRESPAIPIMESLFDAGAEVVAFDPVVRESGWNQFGDQLKWATSLEDGVREADAVLLITRWQLFERLPEIIKTVAPDVLLVDGRRMFRPDSVENYLGIGLPTT